MTRVTHVHIMCVISDLGGGPECLHALDLLLEGREDLGVEAGEGDVDVGVHGQADQHREPGGGQQAQAQAGQDTHQPGNTGL